MEKNLRIFWSELADALLVKPRVYSIDTFKKTYPSDALENITSVKTIYRLIEQGDLKVKI